jgi:hypothetical protein
MGERELTGWVLFPLFAWLALPQHCCNIPHWDRCNSPGLLLLSFFATSQLA